MTEYTRLLVQFKPEVLIEELADEAVLLNLETEHYYGLDSMGVRFWKLLQEQPDSEQVSKTIIKEYDVDEKKAYQDVARFIVQLEEAGLLETTEA